MLYYWKGVKKMGQIVCSVCNSTIDYFEDEKVTVLYGTCPSCCNEEHNHEEK